MTWLLHWLGWEDFPSSDEAERMTKCAEMPWFAALESEAASPFPDAQGAGVTFRETLDA